MKKSLRSFSAAWSGAIALAMSLATTSADAQTPGSRGFATNRFDPTPSGDPFFGADFARYSGSRTWALRFGVVADYAYQPLVARTSSGTVTPIIEHALVTHLQFTAAFLNRFDVNLSMPLHVVETGPMQVMGTQLRAQGFGAGDPRIGARVRLFNQADVDPISLHLGAQVYLGGLWSTALANYSDGSIRARGYLTAAGRASILRWSATVGGTYRPNNVLDNNNPPSSIGPELFFNAGVGLVFLQDRLMLGVEANSAFRLTDFGQSNTGAFPLEGNLGVHYTIADLVQIGLGGGIGFSQAPGTPTFRGLFHVGYAPIDRSAPGPGDTDRDGVLDPNDLCPTVPQGDHPDPARLGCPIGDQDHDGVLDNDDQCVDVPQGDRPDPARRGCPLRDTDSDGVFDNEDQCVDVPQGDHPDPDRRGCPDGDDDNDRVLNHDDQCRNEPAGARPDPARRGCPAPDRDHDTVIDPEDHCPDQPGAPNPNPQLNGCPGLVAVEDGRIRLTRPVFFATNRDVILPRSFPVLRAVRDALVASPQISHVSIEGHTDDVGNDDRNMDLSTRRAASVMRWLTQNGIVASRLESHGFGETRPVTPITGLRGRALNNARASNRRVEFRIVE